MILTWFAAHTTSKPSCPAHCSTSTNSALRATESRDQIMMKNSKRPVGLYDIGGLAMLILERLRAYHTRLKCATARVFLLTRGSSRTLPMRPSKNSATVNILGKHRAVSASYWACSRSEDWTAAEEVLVGLHEQGGASVLMMLPTHPPLQYQI